MSSRKQDLKQAGKELNEALGLVPAIPVKNVSEKVLVKKLKEAKKLIIPQDEISEETLTLLDALAEIEATLAEEAGLHEHVEKSKPSLEGSGIRVVQVDDSGKVKQRRRKRRRISGCEKCERTPFGTKVSSQAARIDLLILTGKVYSCTELSKHTGIKHRSVSSHLTSLMQRKCVRYIEKRGTNGRKLRKYVVDKESRTWLGDD